MTTPPPSSKWDDQIARAIIGPKSKRPFRQPTDPGKAVRSIEAALGLKGRQAARKIGVPWGTFEGWQKGRVKSVPPRLAKAYRRAQLSAAREKRIRDQPPNSGGTHGVRLNDAKTECSGIEATQNANIGDVLHEGYGRNAGAELCDAYLSGIPGEMTGVMTDILETYGLPFGLEFLDLGHLEMG